MKSNLTNASHARVSSIGLASLLAVATFVAGCGGEGPLEPTATGAFAQSASAVSIRDLRLSAATVTAGGSISGTVTLGGSAQSASGGVIVYIGFKSALLAGPKFIRIPNGASSSTFTLYTNPFLSAPASASVSASTSSPQPFSFLTQTVSIAPAAASPTVAPRVVSLALAPSTAPSGTAVTGTVTLDAPAPAVGAVVQLANSNDFFNLDADLPPVVIVPPGGRSATFTVRTHIASAVASSIQEIVVGNYFGGAFQGAYLDIVRAP